MPKAVKQTGNKKQVTKKPAIKKSSTARQTSTSLSVPVYSLEGKESGSLELPKEVFGGKINKVLLSQALRVYLNNLKTHFSHTKTRGEVAGSTRKLYRQKGTGHARHGAITAPIYVGGGIALGPKFRKVILELPKKMKKAAFISALSLRFSEGEVMGISGFDKATGKTSEVKDLLTKLGKNDILLVTDGKSEKIVLATKNLSNIDVSSADQLNTLAVIKHKTILLTKEAVEKLEERFKIKN